MVLTKEEFEVLHAAHMALAGLHLAAAGDTDVDPEYILKWSRETNEKLGDLLANATVVRTLREVHPNGR
jgi:hypothetical protein